MPHAPEVRGEPTLRWCLIVPVKRLTLAKSRLAGYSPDERSALALAFAADTVTAAVYAPTVDEVLVVTDDPTAAHALGVLGARVVRDEPDAGLNPALRHGAAQLIAAHPGCAIGALSSDLPALRTAELARALRRASAFGTSFVPDAGGSGTTAYFARSRAGFAPDFGPRSHQAHLDGGASALPARGLTSLRRDVDTGADLAAAGRLGLGPHTTAVLRQMKRDAEAAR